MNKEVTILMQLRDRVSSGFGKISNAFTASVRRMKDATAGAKKAVGEFIHEMQSGSEKSRAFAEGLKAIAVGAGIIAGAITLAGRSAISAAIEMEALKRGLAAVAGGAQAAEAQMKDLQKVAKLPGLGLPEAIQGSTRLQAVGINAQLANKALMEFGNALARVGKGREELSGVILALTQIVGKGKVTAEEINQIAERVPEVRKVMMEAFGTASTEAIQKMNISAEAFIETLVEGFSKLPRVVGGTRNEIENFNDAVLQAKVAVGQALLPAFTEALGVLTKLVNWFNKLSDTTKSIITWAGAITGGIAALTASATGILVILPQITRAVSMLGAALTFLATNPIGLAITAIGLLAATILILRKDYIDSIITAEKFAKSIDNINERMGETQKIGTLAKELSALQAKTNLTTSETSRLYEIQEKLAEISPRLIKGYDAQGRALAVSKKDVIDYAAEQYKLLDVEREILHIRAKQRAGELSKQLRKEVGLLEGMDKQLNDLGRSEYIIQTRFGELSTKSRERFISGMAKQAEKVRDIRTEYNSLMAEIESAEQQKGIRVELPTLPKVDIKNATLTAKEIEKIEDDIRKTEVKTAEIRAGLINDEQQRELELLRVRHESEIKGIDAKLSELKGATAEELQLAQALNAQKLALETEYQRKRLKIIADYSKSAIKISVGPTETYVKYMQAKRKEEAEDAAKLAKIKIGTTETYFKIRQAQMKQESEDEARLAKIKVGPTETYFKIRQAQIEKETEANRLAYEARWNDFSIFDKNVIAAQDKQLEEFIALTEAEKLNWMTMIDSMAQYTGVLPEKWQSVMNDIITATSAAADIYAGNLEEGALKLAPVVKRSAIALGRWISNWGKDADDEIIDEFDKLFNTISKRQQEAVTRALAITPKKDDVFFKSWIDQMNRWITQSEAMIAWQTEIGKSVSDTIINGIKEGLSVSDIGDNIEKFLKEQIFDRAIQTILTNMPLMQAAIEKWSDLVADALSPESAGGSAITDWEMQFINSAGREIKWMTENVAEEGQKLAETLGLSFDKNIDKAAQSMDAMKAASGFPADYTKVGILPQGGRLPADIHLEDLLMRPQRELWNQMSIDNKSTPEAIVSGGRAPAISDVIETKPGVSFVQNNQFSGLVNFDNPAAMRELARKLQPYTEELQERWVSS